MRFQSPLASVVPIRRQKRFVAGMRLRDGTEVTAHCPNPGAMIGLNAPGLPVWLEPEAGPGRKLRYGRRLAELPGGHWCGIDTNVPNSVVQEALSAGAIVALAGWPRIRPEVAYGRASRGEFLLGGDGRRNAYVEVKNVHLRRRGDCAEFPDSVTRRGTRHLAELSQVAAAGHRAVMLYLVQRTDCARLGIAADLDPAYAAAFDAARAQGVEVLCHGTRIGPEGVFPGDPLPVDPNPQS